MQEGEHVVGLVQPIAQILTLGENPTDDMIKPRSDLEISMSTSSTAEALQNTSRMREIEEWLNSLQETILNWDYIHLMIWERSVGKAAKFVQTVEEIQRLIGNLGCLTLNGYQENNELLQHAHNILPIAMSRLEEDFSHILIENKKPLDPEHSSFQSSDDDMSFVDLGTSADNETSKGTHVRSQRDSTRGLEECIIDLVVPNVIPSLKYIAEVMFASGSGAECCQAYIGIRKDALKECLLVLEVENLSIKDVLQMDWGSLNSKIKKWVRAVKIFVRVCLASEKSLAYKVFGVSGSASQTCFTEASKSLIFQLLSFGEAVAIRNHSPEKIFLILYMCDGFIGLLPLINVLFSDEIGSSVSTEAQKVVRTLGESVRRSLNEFRNAVRMNESSNPLEGSGIHHLTIHVMNYLEALTHYSDTLNILIEGCRDNHSLSSSNVNMTIKDGSDWSSSSSFSPVARCLQSMISILESSLESKSQVYTDASLQHFFLMNNIFYVRMKVEDSKLRLLLGQNWISKHKEKFQQHAVNYKIASWSPVLSFLRSKGICNAKSGLVSKTILKERIRGFNLAFEEIYRTQTAWLIQNNQLRENLRISVILSVVQVYREFLGRYFNHLSGEKHSKWYIKYTVQDLRKFLLDLFEGSPRSLHKSHRLEEEFSHILIENRQPLEPEYLPFKSSNFDMPFVDLIASVYDEPFEGAQVKPQRDNTRGLEEYNVDLVHPNVIPDLKRIADVMCASGYDTECCQAYTSIRKDALEECLLVLEVEKLGIKDVLQMDWSSLNSKIKKWVRAAKIFIRVFLASEKSLADKVFGDSGSVSQTCFFEASKSLILEFLSFGEAVAIRNHSPEKIVPILYMYDGFVDLLPVINVLFSDEVSSFVSIQAHGVLSGLGESVMRALNQFRNAVKTNESSTTLESSGVHHLTRYVMKYLKALANYSYALNFILEVGGDDHSPSSSDMNTAIEVDVERSSCSVSPVSQFLESTISILESNLKRKSQVWTDVSMQHVFLMNNCDTPTFFTLSRNHVAN